jgi:tetratricopeptide (TPR) repeat protein
MKHQRRFTKCPVCGVSVSTNTLAEHLQRVHNKTVDGGGVREHAETNPLKADVDTGNGQIVDITACVMALEKGARLIASRKFKRAINVFETIPEEYPDIDNVYMLIGTSYIQLNRPEDALIYFKKAVKSDPDNPAHWHNLGFAYFYNSYFAKTRECLHKALALNPDKESKENIKKLLGLLKEALELELADMPGVDQETYFELEERFLKGIDFMDIGDLDAAITEFKYVASTDKTSEKAYGNLGLIYLLKGELEVAEEYLKKSLDIDPTYKPASINYRALKKVKKKMMKDPEYLEKMKDKIVMRYF